MLFPSDRLLEALTSELEALLPALGALPTEGSPSQAILNCVRLLHARDSGGRAFVQSQFARFAATLDELETALDGAAGVDFAPLRACIAEAAGEQQLPALERLWRRLLQVTEALTVALNEATNIAPDRRAGTVRKLVGWEVDDLVRQVSAPQGKAMASTSMAFDRGNLSAYLRDRFDDPELKVRFVKPLLGGYGKETTIFAAEGKALSGEFVIRRDPAGEGGVDSQCYRVRKEYPVIRAAHAHGFPAPDALWLDTDHPTIAGGDFMVMRRSPGAVSGTVFGAHEPLPADLVDILADTTARLHMLTPLRELGDLTETIRGDMWDKPRRACIEQCILAWYRSYLEGNHSPSPGLVSIYGWLLENVPDRPGAPVLLHGDIGLHNILFHEGDLSVVVDWESAHIGDPAEELGYIRETIGGSIDWPAFLARYVSAGGEPADPATVHFFRIWAHVRNATGSNMLGGGFNAGHSNELKLVNTAYTHFPHFLRTAQALIEAGPEQFE